MTPVDATDWATNSAVFGWMSAEFVGVTTRHASAAMVYHSLMVA